MVLLFLIVRWVEGRTTTGMVCACIMMRASSVNWRHLQRGAGTDRGLSETSDVVRELVNMLDRGKEAKALADACCKALRSTRRGHYGVRRERQSRAGVVSIEIRISGGLGVLT